MKNAPFCPLHVIEPLPYCRVEIPPPRALQSVMSQWGPFWLYQQDSADRDAL